MKYTTILFDLDGTLTEPAEGITKSVQHALRKHGIIEDDLKKLEVFIGPPLKESFMKYYNFPEEEIESLIADYREFFSSGGLFMNSAYEGIHEVLDLLKEQGRHLLIATSKPDVFTIKILEKYGLAKYFEFVAAATIDEKRTHKEEVVAWALEHIDYASKDEILMVGDRHYDITGAAKNGLDALGVLYGYGSRQELEDAGAKYVVESVSDLKKIFSEEI